MLWDAQLMLYSIFFPKIDTTSSKFSKMISEMLQDAYLIMYSICFSKIDTQCTQFSKMVSEMLQDAQLMLGGFFVLKVDTKSTQFSKMVSEMVQDAQLRLWSIFFEIWLQIDLVSKKWHQNGLGRLVNAVEHFFEKLITNARSFQKWCQKCSRTLS